MGGYLGIIVATIAVFIIGWLWYMPLFGKLWMKLARISKSKKGPLTPAQSMILGVVSTLVRVFVLSLLLTITGRTSVGEAVTLGAWVWLGFLATESFGSVIWESKPFKLWVLNNGYGLLTTLVAAAILAAMA